MARQACAPRYRRDIRPVTAALPTVLERAALHALPGSALCGRRFFHGSGGSTASVPRTEGSGAYRPGDLVEHKVFGRGEVLKVTPVAGDTIVEIRFDTAGVKKTMANYAPLKHISE